MFSIPEPDVEFAPLPEQLQKMPASPMKTASVSASPLAVGDTLSDTAQEITKNIEKSLASSLKLEEEARNSLSRNHMQNNSPIITPLSQTPSKLISPSKLKVRFEDQSGPETSVSRLAETMHSLKCGIKAITPTKNSREDFMFSSPVLKTSHTKRFQGNIDTNVEVRTPFKSSIEASLFSSLKLPQNDEEREKLDEFLRNMETSASGDPLASLFDLEYDLKLSDLNSKPAIDKNMNPSAGVIPSVPKIPEKVGEFQIKRRKGPAKRNLDKKDFSKKPSKPRKENPAKNATVKNSINAVRFLRSNLSSWCVVLSSSIWIIHVQHTKCIFCID